MKKIFAGLSLNILVLFFLIVIPDSQVMAEWGCDNITVTYETCTSCHGGGTEMITATINFPDTPETIQNVPIDIEYDTQELTYTDYTQSGCLPEIYNNIFAINDETPGQLVLSWFFIDAIPAGSGGCLIQVRFENLMYPDIPEICISDLSGDIQDWCDDLPMCCRIEISPKTKTVYSEETIQFAADSFYCIESSSYSWEVTPECGSAIDAGSGFYTAGNVMSDCSDTVTVTDTANGKQISATVNINPAFTISPLDSTVGSGESIVFSGINNGFCENPPIYSWSVVSDIGSTIGTGGTEDAKGYYRAGKEFTLCEDAHDTIRLTADCGGNVKTVETEVTVPPCTVTISPKSAEVKPGETKVFTATLSECCENFGNPEEAVYTWSVNSGGATGNTGNIFTYQAGPGGGKDIVKVVLDEANGQATDTATVSVIPTTTTTIPATTTTIPTTTTTIIIEHECETNADCDDGVFCNGAEICKFTWSTNMAGSTGKVLVKECYPGTDPCPDDGEFCTGKESCDEENDVCQSSGDPCSDPTPVCDENKDICVECLDDAECEDGLYCNGVDICSDGICVHNGDPCTDDGLYCNGEEICDEEIDECVSSGDPCISSEECDEENDICIERPGPIDITVNPSSTFRSHLIPLPIIMFIEGIESNFNQTTTVSFEGDAVWPPIRLVLSPTNILVFSIINPGGLEATESGVKVTVTSAVENGEEEPYEEVGSANLTLTIMSFIFDESEEILK